MSRIRALLGLGAACAACCAAPVIVSWASLAGIASGLAAFGAVEIAVAMLLAAAGGLYLWRRRRTGAADRSCGCAATVIEGGKS